jgi:phage portal protein BeeE
MNTRQLLTAGKDLLNGNFEGAVKSLSDGPMTFPVNSNSYRGAQDGKDWFAEVVGSNVFYFQYAGHQSSLKAYVKCPPVNAIINRKAQAFINGKTWVLNTRGKEATSAEAKRLQALLKKPNPLQSGKQFEAQGYIYQQLFGYTIILPIKPVGFSENIDATALWNIPPFMVDIEETQKLFYQSDTKGIIKQIVLNYKGTQTILKVEDVYIMKDFTPSFESLIIPESRICALELPINNIIGAYESRNVLINYRGALGILTNDPGSGQFGGLPLTETEKEGIQKDFRRYGLKNNQWQMIITSAAMKWQNMGYPTKDLMLFEEIEDDIMRICDSYNYPYQLMSSAKGTTFSNLKEGKQLLYQDAIIPEAESMYEQWNQFFNTEKYSLKLDKDYSHLPVLQEDEVQKMQARFTRDQAYTIEWEKGLITRNQWRVANGEDPVAGDDILIGEVVNDSSTPLAVTIGVDGVQGLIAVLTAQGMSEEAKRATVEIVFGIQPADAARMVVDSQTNSNGNQQQTSQGQQSQSAEGGA